MRGIAGKTFLVAGAAEGIGAGTAARLASEGANVVVGDINLPKAEETVTKIRADGGEAVAIHYDQADEASITHLVSETVNRFGALHGINASAADTSVKTVSADVGVEKMDPAIWERTLRVNVIGPALLIREALPHLRSNPEGGAIVCISSAADSLGEVDRPAYGASKAAINALVRHTASRWGKEKIRTNAIAPGVVMTWAAEIHTDQAYRDAALSVTRSNRLGSPEDIAASVAFLLSDDAAWINGQIWGVDGGIVLRG